MQGPEPQPRYTRNYLKMAKIIRDTFENTDSDRDFETAMDELYEIIGTRRNIVEISPIEHIGILPAQPVYYGESEIDRIAKLQRQEKYTDDGKLKFNGDITKSHSITC